MTVGQRLDMFVRSCLMAALLIAMSVDQTYAARRQKYIRSVIVTTVDAPIPQGNDEWKQVKRRGTLNDIMSMYSPYWRNLWFPVPYDSDDLTVDTSAIRTYYRNLGYLEARVQSASTEPAGHDRGGLERVDVIIVLEGVADSLRYQLLGAHFEGAASIDTASWAEQLKRKHPGRGRYYSPAQARNDVVDLSIRYADTGYLDTVSVQIRRTTLINPIDRNVVEYYRIHEDRPYTLAGFLLSSDEDINTDSVVIADALRDAGLRKGEVLARNKIIAAENNLLELNVFSVARVSPEPMIARPDTTETSTLDTTATSFADTLDVSPVAADVETLAVARSIPRRALVQLSPRRAGDIRGTAGYSNIDGWRAQGGVYYHNFLRQARMIGAESEIALAHDTLKIERLRVAVLLGQPRTEFPRWMPFIGGRGFRIRLDQSFASLWENVDRTSIVQTPTAGTDTLDIEALTRTVSWTPSMTRRLSVAMQAGLAYEFSRTDDNIDEYYGVGKQVSYDHVFTVSGSYDTREDFLRPVDAILISGQIGIADVDLRQLRSSVRPELLVQYYRKLARDIIGAVSISGGFYFVADTGSVHAPNLFWRSDGTPIVRGLVRNDLTGDGDYGDPAIAYILGRFETRFDMSEKLGFAVFADAGMAWVPDQQNEADAVIDLAQPGWSGMRRAEWGLSLGGGPRGYWSLPIRVDFAFSVRPHRRLEMLVGIGQAF
jgi:outer membrane protein assembly factor BamA